MADKYYLDQAGLERLVQYINDALRGKADAGAIPENVVVKSDLADYMKAEDMGVYIDEDELTAELADVIRNSDMADVVRDSDIADVVREADLASYATSQDLEDLRDTLGSVYHYRGNVENL